MLNPDQNLQSAAPLLFLCVLRVAGCEPSPSCAELLPAGFNRVAQSIILSLQSGELDLDVCQSVAQIGVMLAVRLDLLLLLLNCLDNGREQLAIGNAISANPVVLPFDQC